jgi:drug/metabolite transporter (DMT)-like permease
VKAYLKRLSSEGIGVLLLLLSIVLATVEAVVVRLMVDRISVGQLLLMRSLSQIALALWISRLLQGRALALLATPRPGAHLLRSVLTAVAWWCYYKSFQLLPIALATTLMFSSQFFVLLLMRPMLKEHVSRQAVVATSIGFVGVMVAAGLWQPQEMDWQVIFGFVSALLGAVMLLLTRSLTKTESTETILFYMPLMVLLSAIVQSWLDWRALTLSDGAYLLVFAVMGTLASWAHVDAYRHARPSLLAPVTYFRLATGLAAGAWFFGDAITAPMALGVALILLGAWYPRWRQG